MNGVGERRGLCSSEVEEGDGSELLEPRRETERDEKLAGVVPVPVAAMIEGSA
jgi:hypothetical protein